MKRAIVVAAILMCAHACLATTIHVPTDQPTIQAGIDAAVNGDTVLVAPGSYSEQINFQGKGIVVTSSDGPEATSLGSSIAPMVSFISGEPPSAELSGFTFRSGVGMYHIKITNGAEPLIRGNVFRNLTYDVLIFCDGAHPRIIRNLFYNNATGWACIGVNTGIADIINNTFDRNVRGFYSYGATIAKNNIVTNSVQYGIYGSYSELSYNDVWNNSLDYDGGAVAGAGSLSQYPLYVDSANGDYNLEFLSPCVNAGDPDGSFNDADGTRNDMGALPAALVQYPIGHHINYGLQAESHVVLTLTPEIYWTFLDSASTSQVAFELQVGTDRDWTLAEMWSTGVVTSDSGRATYGGSLLTDFTLYNVRLRVFNGIAWGGWVESYFRTHAGRTIEVPVDYSSIQAAIDGALDGDTVLVAPGSYSEQLSFEGKGIVVTSADGPAATLLNTSSTPMVSFVNGESSSAELSGFTFQTIANNQPVKITNGAEPLIRGNIFTKLGATGVLIYCDRAHPRIIRNLFYDNTASSACISVSGGAADIINNTFDRNRRGFFSNGSTVAKNNIVTNSTTYGIGGSYSELSYNDVWNNKPNYLSVFSAGEGSLSKDPLYVDSANGDYSLDPLSPCINAGDPDEIFNDPDGTRNDMGAIAVEFGLPIATNIGFGTPQHGDSVITFTPTIFWTFFDTAGTVQAAYELEVGADDDWAAAEMWSSGTVVTEEGRAVYSGSPLSRNTTYYLRLRLSNGVTWGDWSTKHFFVRPPQAIHVPVDQPTIQAGIDVAMERDTILVSPGSYTEQINFKGKGVVLRSSDGPAVTFLTPSSTPVVSFVSREPREAELHGFTLRGTTGNWHVMIAGSAEPLIQGNVFAGLTAVDVIVHCENSHPRIIRNLFHGNSSGSVCIGISGGAADIINNTLDGNGRGFYSYGSTVAKNNIVTNSTAYGISGSYSDLSYNDVWNNKPDYATGTVPGNGSISQDPQYADLGSHRFGLQITSPCIDAGDPDNAYNDPDRTRNDMGAFPAMLDYPISRFVGFGAAEQGTTVTTLVPTIHWTFLDTGSATQVAYQLEVGNDSDWTVAEMWNTGTAVSAEDSALYAGSPLSDNTLYYLRLRLFNGASWGGWTVGRFFVHLPQVFHVPADQPTIQAGIDAAANWDTVLVAPGTYSQVIDFKGKGVVVTSSEGAAVTILSPPGTPVVSFVANEPANAELSGFTFRSTDGQQHVKISNGAQPLIQHNIFTNLTSTDVIIYSQGSHPRIVRNLFSGNSTSWACIGVANGAADIVNNILDRNSRGFYSYGSAVAKNNIVVNSSGYGIYGSYSELSYNDVWNNHANYEGGAISGIGSISGDPQFRDQAHLDYRLLSTSPCVDAGDPGHVYDDSDGSRNDMGTFLAPWDYPAAMDVNLGAAQHGMIVTTLAPTIHWKFLDTINTAQVAYEVEVGTDDEWTVAEMWSTGLVISGADSAVYAGSPPSDNTTYYLRLRLFNGVEWGGYTHERFYLHVPRIVRVPADAPTIQDAIGGAVDFDTVLVSPGTYSGDVNFLGKQIVLKSEAGATQTILQNSSVSFKSGEDTTSVIDGFSIIGATYGIYISESSPIVTNCDISHCSWDGDGGAVFVSDSRAKIRNNSIHDNEGTNTGGGLYFRNCYEGFEISGNRIYNNKAPNGSGIGSYSCGHALIYRNVIYHNLGIGDYAGGIYVGDNAFCDILNNTITENSAGITWWGFATMDVRYNIIVNNSRVGITQAYSYNDVWNNNPDYNVAVSPEAWSISANPLFCDTASGDVHLQSNSPCAPANNSCGVLIGALPVGCNWSCGDIDGSGVVDITDAVRLLHYLFRNGSEPLDLSGGDVNLDGRLNIADIVYLINYIFVGGPAPCAVGK